eukprot:TRINITY_DN2944_c0_g1_i4.p1 TRINITY_DN2944_c0_g1~~TRINITY_DN2944_c0_g1_i4.p1  ORF type:complete len:357 (-),score=51.12 TRINITY_DN2944_c0_g1_i4:58-1128(-)
MTDQRLKSGAVIREWELSCQEVTRFCAGVEEDIEQFIYSIFYEFDEQYEPRFSLFTRLWKESKLGLIFCGRESFRELYDFTDHIMLTTKKYVRAELNDKPNNVLIRYAALYCLYAFYLKQPCRPKVKVKLSYEEFLELESLIEEARKGLHHDVLYAWSKLIACHAFQYSVVSAHKGVEVARRLDKKDPEVSLIQNSANSYLKSKDFRGVMRRLTKAHTNYTKMKASFMKGNTDTMLSLQSIDEEIIEAIEDIAKEDIKPTGDNPKCLKGPSDIGDKRKKLKEKFFAGGPDNQDERVGGADALGGGTSAGTNPSHDRQQKHTTKGKRKGGENKALAEQGQEGGKKKLSVRKDIKKIC